MKMKLLFAAAALAAAGPAAAADVGQIECAATNMSEATRTALAQAVSERAPHGDPRIVALRTANEQCGRSQSWSSRAVDMAMVYHMSRTGLAGERAWLIAHNFDADALEQAIQNDPIIASGIDGDENAARTAITGFVERNLELLERLIEGRHSEPELMERIGGYIGFRVAMAWARSQFAAA